MAIIFVLQCNFLKILQMHLHSYVSASITNIRSLHYSIQPPPLPPEKKVIFALINAPLLSMGTAVYFFILNSHLPKITVRY